MKRIKVLLVEDDPSWEEMVSHFLNREPDLVVVGTVQTKEDALHIVRMLEIDVVLMDAMLNGNGLNSIATALEIHALHTAKMIMFTFMDHREFILEAFSNGVTDYIVQAHAEDIPAAVRAVHGEQSSIHFVAAGVLRQEFIRMKQMELRTSLTAAESSILRFIYEGSTQSEIMKNLHISESTIKKHVSRIIRKMQVHTSKEAAQKASMKGIL
ncbi:response regulator transcription factor [Paenibacillus alginolyticus]|uniref:LuxR C-terminal-related transcriptional regulator n=1 Tax=Paenibacillus alginolyticus TaxID=59839 RepID=UPI00040C5D65|nr:response regulator transcription factor [Paenibacillus alginolyticus]MCY9668709.1 response regulator transcription factor [Paenibacillus alginolyticus]